MPFATLSKEITQKKRIDKSGKYIGKFLTAEAIKATKKGTTGVKFEFESDEKQTATCKIYIEQVDGTRIFGYDILSSLMACFGLTEIKDPTLIKIKDYDFNSGETYAREAPLLLELSNRPIGVVLQRVEFEKQDGSLGWKTDLQELFDPATGLTGREIIQGKTEPLLLAQMTQSLRDRHLKNKKDEFSSIYSPVHGQQSITKLPGFPLGDDDIPF